MGEVVHLPPKPEPDTYHCAGPLLCLGCRHEWSAVTPADIHDGFECPACGLSKGVARGLYSYREEEHWVCQCGNDLMAVTRQRVYCPNCGRNHKPWD